MRVRCLQTCRSVPRRSRLRWVLILSLVFAAAPAAGGELAGMADPLPRPSDLGRLRSSFQSELLRSCDEGALAQLVVMEPGPAARSLTGAREEEVDQAGRVPPGLAFLMSAVVPGAGQLAEGRRRAFLYLTVEALAWISHFAFEDAGNKKEGEYEAYARGHWDLERWRELAYGDVDTCLNALPPGVNAADYDETLVGFLESGNEQHYYEDIGKLEGYRAGWDDFSCENPDEMSPNRRDYRSMRADSNDYLEKARMATTIAFLNRVVSAVDAYRTSRGARLALSSKTSLELGVAGSLRRPRASLRIRRLW